MKIKANITISRIHGGGIADRINISIRDDSSGIVFVDGEMSLVDFASAVTGLGCCDLVAEVRGLEYVGKVRVSEQRRIEYTGKQTFMKADLVEWLVANAKEDGWLLNSYLGAQNSVAHVDGKTFLNYSVTKYVDKDSVSR